MPDKTKDQRNFYAGFFGGRGWTTQAAHLKKPRRGFFPRRTIRRVDAVRIHPHENPNLLQTEDRQRISTLAVFLWARVDCASRASKKAPQGLFSPPDYSAGRCCSNPPLRVKFKMPDKTKDQRNFYAGFFGGRGWTTQAAHLKKPRRGFFPRRTIRRVDAVRIHPHENPNLLQTEDRQRISELHPIC